MDCVCYKKFFNQSMKNSVPKCQIFELKIRLNNELSIALIFG